MLWSKVFELSKTITGLTKAATDPKKDDQLAENSGKSLGREYMLARKIAVQNKSPSFGSKQPILLSAVAKTPPKLYI